MRRIAGNDIEANSLFLELDKFLQSIRRRSVAYSIYTFTGTLGAISLTLNKLSGSTTKTLICQYDEVSMVWYVYTPRETFEIDNLGQIPNVCKYLLNQMRAHLGRI